MDGWNFTNILNVCGCPRPIRIQIWIQKKKIDRGSVIHDDITSSFSSRILWKRCKFQLSRDFGPLHGDRTPSYYIKESICKKSCQYTHHSIFRNMSVTSLHIPPLDTRSSHGNLKSSAQQVPIRHPGFFDRTPERAASRVIYLKNFLTGVFTTIILIFSVFVIFWNSTAKSPSPSHNLPGWIVVRPPFFFRQLFQPTKTQFFFYSCRISMVTSWVNKSFKAYNLSKIH